MKIRLNDKVKVLAGKDRGKEGKVIKLFKSEGKAVVEGINKVKRHVKPGAVSKEGGIISVEKPIDVSNLMLVDPKTGQPVRVGYKIIDGKKYRVSKKTGDVITK